MSEGSQGMGVHAMKGQILNRRYRITDELGRGGQAITYKAEDNNTNQICVVKHLLPAWSADPNLSDAERSNLWETAKRLFDQEAQALANLGYHPQIPRLLDRIPNPQQPDQVVENQEFYLVQEFIDGQPLSAELPPGQPWSERQVVSLLDEVLAILEFVHSQNVIHRDIKPDNIIRRALDGKLVLVDFGAVKLERQMTEVSSTSRNSKTVSIGTLGYMPLEQQKGKPGFASDLYALGMIGIQALTGKNAADLVLYHEDEESGEINWRPLVTVSDELASFLTQMVRSLPKKRYQSATEARQALPLYRQPEPPLLVTEVAPVGTKTSPPSNPPNQGGTSATNPPPQAKGFRFIRTLTGHAASVGSIAISSDSQTLVSGSDDSTIKLWNLDTGSLIRTFTQQPKFLQHKTTWITSVAISPQSQVLAGGTLDNTVKLWHLNNGSWIRDLKGHSGSVYTVAISPDGQTLVSAGQEKTIKVWNLSSGQMLPNLTGHSDWVYAVAISPDGQTLVSGGRDNTIKVWNLLNSKLPSTLTGHIDWVRCVAISPDGKTIASGSYDNTIKLWNRDSGQLIRTLTGHSHRVTSVAISQDGTTLISGSHDKTIKLWDMGNGNLIHTLTGHLESVCCVATSPDGKTIASSSDDGAIKIWQPN